jgi:5-methylcytosine-specific restriction enzyme A
MQFCAEPGCGVLVLGGRCPVHAPRERRAHVVTYANTQRMYDSVRWARLRREVIQDEPFCRACRRAGRRSLTVDVDHIVPHRGNPAVFWDRANLQGLCKRCHTTKTNRGE